MSATLTTLAAAAAVLPAPDTNAVPTDLLTIGVERERVFSRAELIAGVPNPELLEGVIFHAVKSLSNGNSIWLDMEAPHYREGEGVRFRITISHGYNTVACTRCASPTIHSIGDTVRRFEAINDRAAKAGAEAITPDMWIPNLEVMRQNLLALS